MPRFTHPRLHACQGLFTHVFKLLLHVATDSRSELETQIGSVYGKVRPPAVLFRTSVEIFVKLPAFPVNDWSCGAL